MEGTGFRRASRSPIARDPELAKFIMRAFDTMTIRQIRDACRATFGEDRAPSFSAIHRFLDAVEKAS